MDKEKIAILTVAAVAIVAVLAFTMIVHGDNGKDGGQPNSLSPIELKFTIDETKVKVMWGDQEIKNQDTVTFPRDATLNVSTIDGMRHNITYGGSWSNAAGENGSTSGSNLAVSTQVIIPDTIFFGKATGTMSISYT